jgi:hypothetical protein
MFIVEVFALQRVLAMALHRRGDVMAARSTLETAVA